MVCSPSTEARSAQAWVRPGAAPPNRSPDLTQQPTGSTHGQSALRQEAARVVPGGDGGREPPAARARPGAAHQPRRRRHHRHRHLRAHRHGRPRQGRPGADALLRRRRASPASSPRCATPSSPRWSRWPARPTPTPTPRWASCSPGSSAGTWSSSTPSASATVAHGWSHYFQDFIGIFGLHVPTALRRRAVRLRPGDRAASSRTGTIVRPARDRHRRRSSPSILVKGIRESASFNAVMVIIKLAIVLFVIVVGAFYVNPANWQPVRPLRLQRASASSATRSSARPAPAASRSACWPARR